jgi:hypothetical protein
MTSVNEPYVFIENDQLSIHSSPNVFYNNRIIENHNINTNRKYREYLQKNALTIQDVNFKVPLQALGNTIPYTFYGVNDNSRPRGYETSVPKQKFLSEQFIIANQTRAEFDSFAIEKI